MTENPYASPVCDRASEPGSEPETELEPGAADAHARVQERIDRLKRWTAATRRHVLMFLSAVCTVPNVVAIVYFVKAADWSPETGGAAVLGVLLGGLMLPFNAALGLLGVFWRREVGTGGVLVALVPALVWVAGLALIYSGIWR